MLITENTMSIANGTRVYYEWFTFIFYYGRTDSKIEVYGPGGEWLDSISTMRDGMQEVTTKQQMEEKAAFWLYDYNVI